MWLGSSLGVSYKGFCPPSGCHGYFKGVFRKSWLPYCLCPQVTVSTSPIWLESLRYIQASADKWPTVLSLSSDENRHMHHTHHQPRAAWESQPVPLCPPHFASPGQKHTQLGTSPFRVPSPHTCLTEPYKAQTPCCL